MENINSLSIIKIHFFDQDIFKVDHNTLKQFIYYLKENYSGALSFNYVPSTDTFNNKLSIIENILSESNIESHNLNDLSHVHSFITEMGNPYLRELISSFSRPHDIKYPRSQQDIKVLSLIKAIIGKGKYILLENPELHLSSSFRVTLKNALLFESRYHKRVVFIRSNDYSAWQDIVTKYISPSQDKKKVAS